MCIDSKHVYTWLSMAVNQSREICSAPNAQQHVTDLALLIQLALLRPLQRDQEVCSLVRHRAVLVQHHTEALQTVERNITVLLCIQKEKPVFLVVVFPSELPESAQLGLPWDHVISAPHTQNSRRKQCHERDATFCM